MYAIEPSTVKVGPFPGCEEIASPANLALVVHKIACADDGLHLL